LRRFSRWNQNSALHVSRRQGEVVSSCRARWYRRDTPRRVSTGRTPETLPEGTQRKEKMDERARAGLAREVKAEAARLGFDACGISKAERLDDEARRLERWLREGRHATMGWMENHFDKRTDPRALVEGAQTVVSVLQNYYQPAA